MKIDIDENYVMIELTEKEADKLKELDSGAHEHFKYEDKELIITKK